MVRCSGAKKADCAAPSCKWEKSKCYSAVAKAAKKAEVATKKVTKTKSATKSVVKKAVEKAAKAVKKAAKSAENAVKKAKKAISDVVAAKKVVKKVVKANASKPEKVAKKAVKKAVKEAKKAVAKKEKVVKEAKKAVKAVKKVKKEAVKKVKAVKEKAVKKEVAAKKVVKKAAKSVKKAVAKAAEVPLPADSPVGVVDGVYKGKEIQDILRQAKSIGKSMLKRTKVTVRDVSSNYLGFARNPDRFIVLYKVRGETKDLFDVVALEFKYDPETIPKKYSHFALFATVPIKEGIPVNMDVGDASFAAQVQDVYGGTFAKPVQVLGHGKRIFARVTKSGNRIMQ